MILCLACKRLSPAGSNWCGACKSTLGKRICSEGHQTLLSASCCSICGSTKLSPGVPSLNLRLAIHCLSLVLAYLFIPPLAKHMWSILADNLFFIWLKVLQLLTLPITVSILVALFGGDSGRTMVAKFWKHVIRLPIDLVMALAKLVGAFRKQKKSRSKREED